MMPLLFIVKLATGKIALCWIYLVLLSVNPVRFFSVPIPYFPEASASYFGAEFLCCHDLYSTYCRYRPPSPHPTAGAAFTTRSSSPWTRRRRRRRRPSRTFRSGSSSAIQQRQVPPPSPLPSSSPPTKLITPYQAHHPIVTGNRFLSELWIRINTVEKCMEIVYNCNFVIKKI